MEARFLIESFWQRGANCTVVAFAKAMWLQYGSRGSFRIKKMGTHILVTLRDKRVVVLSFPEIAEINKGNQFHFRKQGRKNDIESSKQVRVFAELIFAILVRSMQIQGYNSKEFTQRKAIRALTKEGMTTEYFHTLLGIRRTRSKRLVKKDLSRLSAKKVLLLYNDRHITVVAGGYYEENGVAIRLTDKIPVMRGKRATGWFSLR